MKIDGSTVVVGIVASPISHVSTPQIFNASVANQGINAVCVPLHVEPEHLQSFLDGAATIKNFHGLVVTIPHKESVVAACAELSETARLIGSVNAMRFDSHKGHWIGGNFDGDGFVAGLRERKHSLTGKRVLQIGAGGAGKSMAYAIARERPAELVIYNRSAARAAELVAQLRQALPNVSIRTGENNPAGFDVVVNASSLGLRNSDPTPVPVEQLSAGTLVCEAVVRDGDTALLKAAGERGCEVHHGQWMLYGQIVEIARFLGVPLTPEHVIRILGPFKPGQ